MNQEFWNERYSNSEYAYGTEPNEYLKERLTKLDPGKILFPCEGEGRNSVYAAGLGWTSIGFDSSTEGQKKAFALAKEKNTKIHYTINTVLDYPYPISEYDAVGIFYAHMPINIRKNFHEKLIQSLKPGGCIVLEGFHTEQLGRASGGPKDINMLYTPEILAEDFQSIKIIELKKEVLTLQEGKFHEGEAAIMRMFARKS
jgi:SAM-dependent methyltransferase